ncbi:MAG: DegT/DnrJ/EryC1/StrS family aminotransferase [Anaerohalosphaeraceae bacterium]|nr:DegT/DnrJ/EryC1/StrS family aminotransferase [Anaerohalosphaeraceae bacterium]
MNGKNKSFRVGFASYFNANHAFSFWKARVALYALFKTIGVGPGDEIILPGYTCVMDVNPIKYVGAKPIYVDIEPDTFNMNVELLEEKITPNTKVILAQHTYGYVCDIEKIIEIAEKNNIAVIEDCCLSLGSKYKGRLAGTFGKAAYFSFQWNKPFTTGLGGMAITNDSELADKIKRLCEEQIIQPSFKEKAMLSAQLAVYRTFIYPRTTALAQSLFRWLTKKGIVVGSSATCEFEPVMMDDFFKGMSYVQSKSGIGQLRKLEQNINHRKEMAALYDTLLSEKGWRVREYDTQAMDPVMVRYPVRITEKEKALEQAASAGVELGSWFECPLHPIETPMTVYDYEMGMCPEAEKAAKEVVNLPLHPRANKKTAKRTVEFITKYTQAK